MKYTKGQLVVVACQSTRTDIIADAMQDVRDHTLNGSNYEKLYDAVVTGGPLQVMAVGEDGYELGLPNGKRGLTGETPGKALKLHVPKQAAKPAAKAKKTTTVPASVRKAGRKERKTKQQARMAKVQEHIKVREALIKLGFTRVDFTPDHGDGHYDEKWTNGTDNINLRWKQANMLRIEANEHWQSKTREKCEKCGTSTRWMVRTLGREAAWCGCGNY